MALERLLAGQMPPRGAGVRESAWRAPEDGSPLLAWLKNAGPAGAAPEAGLRVPPLMSKKQKAGDCVIESKLTWLATVLPPPDYKLAKAAFLSCLKEVGELQGSLHPRAGKRLDDRITSSLGGSLVAPALDPFRLPERGVQR